MLEKTKKIILVIELIFLVILSVFISSTLIGNAKNNSPLALASAEVTSGKAPLNVTFKGSGSDNDGFIISYFWDFGDGATSKLQNPTHIYQGIGKFIVTLIVTDDNGAIGKEKIIINVEENAPSAVILETKQVSSDYVYTDFTWSPEYPDVGEIITFRKMYYYYYYWEITFNYWNFGDGSKGFGSIVTHTYNKKGNYKVTLRVSGADIYGYSDHYITVGASPFPRFTWLPDEPTTGEIITFDASGSWDTNGKIMQYNWSYTDESQPNKVIYMGNNKTFTYKWDKQGIYKIKLAVTDDDNNTNEITKTIVVSILRIEEITSGFRNLDFKITNRGNISAENIKWKLYVNRNLLIIQIPLWKIISRTGTINTINPGESKTVDIGWYRRGFGRITITIIAEADNAVKITKSLQGFMFSKYIHQRS